MANLYLTEQNSILRKTGDRLVVDECILDGELLERMTDRIAGVILEAEDSVRIYNLCAGCEKGAAVIGQGEVSHQEDVYIL